MTRLPVAVRQTSSAEFRYAGGTTLTQEEARLQSCREMGDLVRLLAVLAIVAVTSLIVVSSLAAHSRVVSLTPDWRAHRAVGNGR